MRLAPRETRIDVRAGDRSGAETRFNEAGPARDQNHRSGQGHHAGDPAASMRLAPRETRIRAAASPRTPSTACFNEAGPARDQNPMTKAEAGAQKGGFNEAGPARDQNPAKASPASPEGSRASMRLAPRETRILARIVVHGER